MRISDWSSDVCSSDLACVENDQNTDAENQQGEEEAQSIKAQAQVESELRQPLVMDDFGLAGKYVGPFGQQQNQRCQWRQARAKGTSGATKPLQDQRKENRPEGRGRGNEGVRQGKAGRC